MCVCAEYGLIGKEFASRCRELGTCSPRSQGVRVWRSTGLARCPHHCATTPALPTPQVAEISLPSQVLKPNRKGEVLLRSQYAALVLSASPPDLSSPCANSKEDAMSVLSPKDSKTTQGAGARALCPNRSELVLNGNVYISHLGFVWNQNSIPWLFTWNLNTKKSPLFIPFHGMFHTDILGGLWRVRGYSSWRQGDRYDDPSTFPSGDPWVQQHGVCFPSYPQPLQTHAPLAGEKVKALQGHLSSFLLPLLLLPNPTR